jgi:hypothetical protein
MGYTFHGPTSYYRLAVPEMRTLRAGWAVQQREQQDRQNGVDPGDRSRLQQFNERLQAGEVGDNTDANPSPSRAQSNAHSARHNGAQSRR